MNKIDRTNMPYNNIISDYNLLNKMFNCANLIQTNQHLSIFQQLKDLVLSNYTVVARFEYLGYNGDIIWANSQRLVYRANRDSNFSLGNGVILRENNLNTKGGGSRRYPSVAFKGAYCILEFTSYGLPVVDDINGWFIHIYSITKL